jgi:hypothetical protein
MSRSSSSPSSLRQKLQAKLNELQKILEPAFGRDPLLPGSLTTTHVRCGKAGCRCERGELHPSVRIHLRFEEGVTTRSLSQDQLPLLKSRVEAYRAVREVPRRFRKWQKEVLMLLEDLERARHSTEGLSKGDEGKTFK